MMNKNIEIINEIYKPYKVTKKNNVYILNTTSGNIVIKPNPKINYHELYTYLKSRNFNYIPKYLKETRDDLLVLEYQEDIVEDPNQKAQDLINLIALLHIKTSYFKNVSSKKHEELYETLKNNILYLKNKYEDFYNTFITHKYMNPSELLFLKNYTLFHNAINYCQEKIEEWYKETKDKDTERLVLIHNNLKLEHIIKNSNEYLISWDNYTFDTPILDLYVFYKNEWEDIDFKEIIKKYNNTFPLLKEEKILFNILISTPEDINFNEKEYNNTYNIRKIIDYLNKSSNTIIAY